VTEDDDIGAKLRELMTRGQTLKRENEAAMREVRESLPTIGSDVVSVSFDSDGLLAEVRIDSAMRTELEAQQLITEINSAIFSASGLLAAPNSGPVSLDDAAKTSAFGVAFVDDLVSVLATGGAIDAERVSNDLGTVTVTALLGNVTSVDCSLPWLESTSDALIGEEIVRVARTAAQQTDILGRYTKGESDD
jgi:hypothetical protein